MTIYSKKFSIPLPWIIAASFVILIGIFVGFSIRQSDKSWGGEEGLFWIFAVGAVPGLVVALAQFILSWAEFGEISRLRNL
jgi:ABC-type Fe3+ transport system permease subunit